MNTVYTKAPGVVLRCRHFEAVLLVITQHDGKHVLGFKHLRCLGVSDLS
jgi:hypothetical protein